MKTDLYNKHHLIFILLFTISNQSKRVNHIHGFSVYILTYSPYSLPKPATEAKSASSFILSRPHCLPRGARFETAESHSFLLAPIQRVGGEHSETKGASAKNHQKFLSSFQKSQFPVIYIVEGHEKARGFDKKHSIYFQDGHRKCRNGMPEFKKGTAFLPSPFPER